MEDKKKMLIALSVFAIVAVLGMVMMFKTAVTGRVIAPSYTSGDTAALNSGLQPWQQQLVARGVAARNHVSGAKVSNPSSSKAIVDPTFKPVSG